MVAIGSIPSHLKKLIRASLRRLLQCFDSDFVNSRAQSVKVRTGKLRSSDADCFFPMHTHNAPPHHEKRQMNIAHRTASPLARFFLWALLANVSCVSVIQAGTL